MCVVVRKRSALRWGGAKKSTQFSAIHGPWFKFLIIHHFKSSDFRPATQVEAVLFRVDQRKHSLIYDKDKNKYKQFVRQGFGGGRRLKQNLSGYYSADRLNKITQGLGVSINAKPSEISLLNWINLFKSQ